jgi:hypothetical protein
VNYRLEGGTLGAISAIHDVIAAFEHFFSILRGDDFPSGHPKFGDQFLDQPVHGAQSVAVDVEQRDLRDS